MAKRLVDKEIAKFDAQDRVRVDLSASSMGSVPVATTDNGFISTSNSSEALLGISEQFVGTWADAINYVEVIVTVHADEPSATDGLLIE